MEYNFPRDPQSTDLSRDWEMERKAEYREMEADRAWEYRAEPSTWDLYRENWVEAHEFTGLRKPATSAMQQHLPFTEVA